jgi:hypothetical protein
MLDERSIPPTQDSSATAMKRLSTDSGSSVVTITVV